MAADEDAMEKANTEGTRNVIEFANSLEVGRFHHTSSIAVAGQYKGVFQEDMFDEGQTSRTPTTAPSTSPSGSCARASRRRR